MAKRMTFHNLYIRILCFGAMAIALFLLMSCSSAVESINSEVSTIDELSQSSESRFIAIADLSDDSIIQTETEYGIIEQQSIQDSVAEIREALPRVEDKDPSWMVLFERMSIAVIMIATIIIIWQTGIGSLIRRLFYSVSWFIPRRSMRDAEMDMKIADSENSMTIKEVMASKRSSDPAYNAAYEKVKRNKS
jgi:hypothetical protein